MFDLLKTAFKRLSKPKSPRVAHKGSDDPFESIRRATSSMSLHFNKLGSDFEQAAELDLSPIALPEMKKRAVPSSVKPPTQREVKKKVPKSAARTTPKTVAPQAKTPAPVKPALKSDAASKANAVVREVGTPIKKAPTASKSPAKKPTATAKSTATAKPAASKKPVVEKPLTKKPTAKKPSAS